MAFALTAGLAVGIVVVGAFTVLYYAWSASVLWAWFMVPIFAAPALSVMQAWGVMLALSALRPSFTKPDEGDEKWSPIVKVLATPLVALAIGWFVKDWI